MADVFFTVGATVDDAQVASEAGKAGKTFGSKFTQSSKAALGNANELFKDVEASIKRIRGLQSNLGKTGLDVGQFAPLARGLDRLLTLQREFARDRERLSKDTGFLNLLRRETEAVQALTSSQTRELQSTVAATNVEARRVAHEEDRNNALRNVQAQRDATLQINAARTAGKARIVLAQQIGAQLLSAERIISQGITNIIRGTAKAVGKIWDGTVGSVRRSFSQRNQVISGGLRNESRLITQSSVISQRANQGIVGAIGNNLGAIGGGLALGAAARQIFTLGSDFTRGLNVLQAQLGLTAAEMKTVSDTAIQLGNDITLPGVSALDAAQAIQLLTKQFGSLGKGAVVAAEAASKGTLQLARAVGAPAEDAAQAVGVAVNVFTKDAANATAVADGLAFALSKAAGTSFQDFNQAFTQAATVFSAFQTPVVGGTKSLDEFNAAIAILAKGGLVGSDAGTSLRNFFTQANRGTDEAVAALEEVTKRAGQTGSVFFDAAGKGRTLTDSIAILQNGLVGLTEEQRQQTLQTIFGTDAIRAANILVGEGAQAFQQLTDAVGKEGFASKLAAAQNKGLAGALDAIKSQFETFAILIFQKVNPILGDVGLKIAGFIDSLANGEGAFAVARRALLGIGAALGVIVAIKGLSEVAGIILSIVQLLGPFGVLVAVLGAVIAVASKNSEGLGETLGRARDNIVNFGKAVARFVIPQLEKLRDFAVTAVTPLIDKIRIFGLTVQRVMKPATDRLADFLHEAKLVVQFLSIGQFSAALGRLKILGSLITDSFKNINLGPINDIIKGSISKIVGGAGLGAVIGGIFGGPVGAAIGAALGAAIVKFGPTILAKLKAVIASIDVGALFGKFLQGVQLVGQKIGELLSSKQFLLGLAGIAAAAAAIGANFIIGFVKGVLGNLGSIADAGAAILNALFDQGSVVKSVLALAIVFRNALTKGFVGAVKSDARKTGQEIGKQIAQGTQEGVQSANLGAKLSTSIKKAASFAGSALASGLSAGLAGSALGSAKSGTEQLLGLGSLAASVASAGAAFGAPGAAAAAGIGLVTLAMSKNATAAAEAKTRMEGFRDAMIETGSVAGGVAKQIDNVFGGTQIPTAIKQLLSQTSFTTEGLSSAISSGKGTQFAKDIRAQVLEITHSVPDAIAVFHFLEQSVKDADKAAKDLKASLSLKERETGVSPAEKRMQGIADRARDARDRVNEANRAIVAAIVDQRAETQSKKIEGIKTQAENLRSKAEEARTALDKLLHPEAGTSQQATTEAVGGLKGTAEQLQASVDTGLATAFDQANLQLNLQPLKDQLSTIVEQGVKEGKPADAIINDLQTVRFGAGQLPFSQDVQSLIGTAIDSAIAQVHPAIDLTQVAVTDDAKAAAKDQFAALSQIITSNIPAVQIPAEADPTSAAAAGTATKAAAQTAFDANPLTVTINTESANAAADSFEQRLAESTRTSGAAASAAQAAGAAVSAGLAQGITSGSSAVSAAATSTAAAADTAAKARLGISSPSTVFQAMGVNAGQGLVAGLRSQTGPVNAAAASMVSGAAAAASRGLTSFNAIGRNIVTSVANGIRSASTVVVKSITATAGTLVQTMQLALKIGSPSKVFMGIGEDIVKGLAIGITETTEAAVSAAEDVAKAVVEATQSQASRLAAAGRSATGEVFSLVFDSAAQQARTAGIAAGRAIITALGDIADSVASEAVKLWNAAAKAVGERTPEEQRIVNASNFTSAFNFSNQEAITKAVEAIKDIGTSLIDQGQSAQQAADAMIAYRGALISAAAAAGINANEVAGIVDSLGLSNSALAEFVRLSNQAAAIVGASPGFIPTTPAPLTPGPNAATTFILNNEFATPFDDPEAVSLAVVNRLAQQVRR